MTGIRVLQGFVVRQLLETLGWRSFMITLMINQAIAPVLGLVIWSAALPANPTIPSYYLALLIVQMLTVSYEHHTLANGIYDGSFSHDLLIPQPAIYATLGINIAMRIWHLVFALPLIGIIALVSGPTYQLPDLLLALPALALAAVVRFLFTYCLALTAFWLQQAHGIVGVGETLVFLLGGIAAPITLFPAELRSVGEALPFRAMLGFPVELAAGSLTPAQIASGYGWQLVWLVVGVFIANRLWRAGVRRFTAIGG